MSGGGFRPKPTVILPLTPRKKVKKELSIPPQWGDAASFEVPWIDKLWESYSALLSHCM